MTRGDAQAVPTIGFAWGLVGTGLVVSAIGAVVLYNGFLLVVDVVTRRAVPVPEPAWFIGFTILWASGLWCILLLRQRRRRVAGEHDRRYLRWVAFGNLPMAVPVCVAVLLVGVLMAAKQFETPPVSPDDGLVGCPRGYNQHGKLVCVSEQRFRDIELGRQADGASFMVGVGLGIFVIGMGNLRGGRLPPT